MKYTESEVLDIIRTITDKDPIEVFESWVNNQKANKLLDLTEYNYPVFAYTFPIKIEGKEVAEVTLANLYSFSAASRDVLMLKYLGKENYDKSLDAYSHDTYLSCYLTIHKEFKLPEICEGMCGDTLQALDANYTPFQFTIAYGYPNEEEDSHLYYQWVDGGYRFDNGVTIKIDRGTMKGWSLGEKINENIEKRLIPYKRAEKLNKLV